MKFLKFSKPLQSCCRLLPSAKQSNHIMNFEIKNARPLFTINFLACRPLSDKRSFKEPRLVVVFIFYFRPSKLKMFFLCFLELPWWIFLTKFFEKIFDEFFWKNFWRIFSRIFLMNFLKDLLTYILTYNLLTFASFMSRVPSILFSQNF